MHRSDYLSCMAMAVKQQGLLGDKERKKRNTSATAGRYGYELFLQIVVSAVKIVRPALQAKVNAVK